MPHLTKNLIFAKPESKFDQTLEQEFLSKWRKLAELINNGLSVKDNFAAGQQDHIEDADGTLADLTTKFNTLLAELETAGILKSS